VVNQVKMKSGVCGCVSGSNMHVRLSSYTHNDNWLHWQSKRMRYQQSRWAINHACILLSI